MLTQAYSAGGGGGAGGAGGAAFGSALGFEAAPTPRASGSQAIPRPFIPFGGPPQGSQVGGSVKVGLPPGISRLILATASSRVSAFAASGRNAAAVLKRTRRLVTRSLRCSRPPAGGGVKPDEAAKRASIASKQVISTEEQELHIIIRERGCQARGEFTSRNSSLV